MQPNSPSPRHLSAAPDDADNADLFLERRVALRHKHVQNLTQLMAERGDLRGVYGFADFVDDSVRWSA
ncbi:hypothetical protein [Nocardioides montaniterrae]